MIKKVIGFVLFFFMCFSTASKAFADSTDFSIREITPNLVSVSPESKGMLNNEYNNLSTSSTGYIRNTSYIDCYYKKFWWGTSYKFTSRTGYLQLKNKITNEAFLMTLAGLKWSPLGVMGTLSLAYWTRIFNECDTFTRYPIYIDLASAGGGYNAYQTGPDGGGGGVFSQPIDVAIK